MADSDIGIGGLTATGGAGQIILLWSVIEASCLPYLRLDKVEVWESATNDRSVATKIYEVFGTQIARGGLARSTTRYYWVRPRDLSGNVGEFYPLSPTNGVAGTTSNENPPPNSVGTGELQDDAVTSDKIVAGAVKAAKIDAGAVTTPKLAAGAVTADKITVTDLSAITANLGTVTAGTINGLTINGGTITGAVIRTATSGNRVELSGSQVMWTPSGVTPIMYIRAIDGVTPFNITWSLPSEPLMMVRNNSTGPSARFYGNGTTPAVVEITQDGGTSSGNVALYARNLRTGGGRGYAGLPNGDGGFAFYSGAGGYGPFTGQHEAFLLKAEIVEDGDIVVDWRVVIRKGIDDTVTEVRVSETRGQKAVVGVVSRRVTLDPEEAVKMKMAALPTRDHEDVPTFTEKWLRRKFDLLIINSLGEGQVNVCGRNGNIERGDLLMSSSMRGKAERQDDDIQRSITVAKAREDVIFDHPDQVRRVACIYLCG